MESKKNPISGYIRYRELAKYIDLIPGFIHNLNTPLMSISGRAELIQFKHPDVQGVEQIIKQLEKITETMDSFKYAIGMDKEEQTDQIKLNEFVTHFNQFMKLNLSFKHKVSFRWEVDENLTFTAPPFIMQNVSYEVILFIISRIPGPGDVTLKIQHDSQSNDLQFVFEYSGLYLSQNDTDLLDNSSEANIPESSISNLIVAKNLVESINGRLTTMKIDNINQIIIILPNIEEE